jgi:hypothetical protein
MRTLDAVDADAGAGVGVGTDRVTVAIHSPRAPGSHLRRQKLPQPGYGLHSCKRKRLNDAHSIHASDR